MGLFSYGMKEGPGVDKNARKKKGFFLYIDIVFRKFLKLMQADALYFLCALPYLALLFCVVSPTIMQCMGFNEINFADAENISAEELKAYAQIAYSAIITLFIFCFMGAGPVSASYAFVTRCFTRGEHAWIGSDGKDKFKENFKQSMLLLLLDVIVLIFGFNAIYFYRAATASTTGMMTNLYFIARGLTMALMFVYIAAHYYIYQIMVTYNCKFIELLKYSLIIAIAKLPMTILLTVICVGVYCLAVSFLGANPFILALLIGVLGLTFIRYPIEFYAARVIEKNIKAERKKEKARKAEITYIED